MSAKAHRLPPGVRPRSYHVHLRASPDLPRVEGSVRIEVELDQPTQAIELHARDLAFRSVAAEQQGQRVEGQAAVDKEAESATLRFPRALGPGKVVLDLAWEAPVSPSMQGLYLSKDGPEQCLVTQCEATDARAVFPCWDEPAFKATLQWTVTAPAGLQVLANGPLLERKEGKDGWATWTFAPTAPMSSYLAAVAIGRFASTPEQRAGGVPFRTWAMEGKEPLGADANAAAARMLPWYEAYFGAPYRFGKYDQLAVPSFSFGAMENAGLVVFRASRLLMDPRTASWRDRRDILLVVAHEFAHQWFGNLVTMRWWDDLWLNESFAEWIAHQCVHELWPQHEVWIDFQQRTSRALATDALGATHPVYQPVATPAEASEAFDAITYGKGSAVLRMLEGFLGPEAFRAGLRSYMAAFSLGNAAGSDLWRHLGAASGRDVVGIMGSWIHQPGHPVVAARLEGATLRLGQERFRSRPGAEPGAQRWQVPLVVRFEDDAGLHQTSHLLDGPEGSLALPARGQVRWAHVNADDLGVYRTAPDEAMLARLAAHAAKLTPAERSGLLRDQWALARSGKAAPGPALEMVARLAAAEDHYATLEQAADIARDAERLLEAAGTARAVEGLRRWAAQAFGPALARVGHDAAQGESPAVGLVRAAAYRGLAGIGREPKATEAALAIAARELRDPTAVDPNVAGTVVALAALHGDAARFDQHLAAYLARRASPRPPQEAERYLGSLTQFRPAPLVERALGLLEDGTVPKQSVGPLLIALLREPHAQRIAWPRVRGRWAPLREQLGDSWAANLVEATGALHPALRPEAEAFLAAHAADFVQSGARARDLLAEREAVHAHVLPALAAWARAR